MPFGISIWELLILLVVLFLVFGAKRLPEMGRSLGKGMREFKEGVSGVEETVTAPEPLGSRVQATPAQVALAWLLAQGLDIVPIFGTTRRARLRENLGALDARLAASDLSELARVFAPGVTSGERYGAAGLAMLDRGPGR